MLVLKPTQQNRTLQQNPHWENEGPKPPVYIRTSSLNTRPDNVTGDDGEKLEPYMLIETDVTCVLKNCLHTPHKLKYSFYIHDISGYMLGRDGSKS